ncbi:MAG: hypothetical protein GF308_21550 [Candidatus Heimdallarchaeota archaeon]|nr:hypothetical protein [Candidatus Heimdallarchaeota archaeon]
MADKTTFPLAAIDRLMREYLPDNKIAKDAKIEFDKALKDIGKLACEKAVAFTNDDKRKTVSAEDVKAAFETIGDTG